MRYLPSQLASWARMQWSRQPWWSPTVSSRLFKVEKYQSGWIVLFNYYHYPVNLQLLFIADLKHKYIREDQKKCKPGRQIVTFLILSNFGLWITYNFEIQKVRKVKFGGRIKNSAHIKSFARDIWVKFKSYKNIFLFCKGKGYKSYLWFFSINIYWRWMPHQIKYSSMDFIPG